MLHFFCSALLGTLSSCNNVSEHQVHALLQVVVEGLRSDSRDFFALGAILAARVLPRVALKAKVADKLAKVLDKKVRRAEEEADMDTLTLTLILFKSQRKVVDKERILRLLSRHRAALEAAFNPKEEGDLNATLVRKTLSALASVCEAVSSSPDPGDNALSLFESIQSALNSPVAPELDHDSVVVLIKSASKAYLAYKAMKKSAAKSNSEERAEQCKLISTSCKKVLAQLKSLYPQEYAEHSAVQSGAVDIAFIGGKYKDGAPTHEEIAAKRVLLDDATVAALTKEFDLSSVARKVRCSETKRTRKESAHGVSLLFESVSPSFILDQVEGERLARLVVNLMSAYDKKPSVIEPILKFACGQEFQDDECVRLELGETFDFELALLPYLVVSGDKWQSVLATIKNSWFIKNRATFLSNALEHLPTEKIEKDNKDALKKVRNSLLKKLSAAIDIPTLADLVKKAVSDKKHHDPTVFAILMHLASERLKSKASKATLSELSEAILTLVSCGVETMELLNEGEDKTNELHLCRTHRKLSTSLTKQCLEAISCNKELAGDKATWTKMLYLACPAKKKNMTAISKAAVECFGNLIGSGEKMESYTLEILGGSAGDDCSIVIHARMRSYCGKKLRAAASASKESRKRILKFRSNSFGRVLAVIGDPDNKVARQAFSVLEVVVQNEESDSAHQSFYPLAAYLVSEKAQILAGDNLSASFERFLKSGGKESEACARALLNRCTSEREEWPTFARLEPVLKCLRHPTEMATLAEFGLELIKEEGADSSACLAILAGHFMPRLLANMDRRPCLDFVLAAAALGREVPFAGVSQKVGVLALRNLQGAAAPDCSRLFEELVSLADKVEDGSILFECRGVIKGLGVTAEMFLRLLEDVWSAASKEEPAKAPPPPTSTRSSRRLSQLPPKTTEKAVSNGSIVAMKSYSKDERWRITLFTLEMFLAKSEDGLADSHVLMKMVFQLLKRMEEEEREDSYALDVLLSSALAILDQSCSQGPKAGESAGAAVNPELLVKCLNSSADPTTRSTALMVLARSCAAGDAEYVIQNSVSIFTFMGSHFLRVDSKHSFEVACAAIDIIVPHIQKVH